MTAACETCGTPFQVTHPLKRFCSERRAFSLSPGDDATLGSGTLIALDLDAKKLVPVLVDGAQVLHQGLLSRGPSVGGIESHIDSPRVRLNDADGSLLVKRRDDLPHLPLVGVGPCADARFPSRSHEPMLCPTVLVALVHKEVSVVKTDKPAVLAADPGHVHTRGRVKDVLVREVGEEAALGRDVPASFTTSGAGTDRALAVKRVLVPMRISRHIASIRNRRRDSLRKSL